MIKEENSALINAPAQTLYNLLIDPANLIKMLRGNLADVSNITPLPGGGYRYEWTYRLAGFPIRATGEMIELVPYSRLVIKSSGGMETISTWNFAEEAGGTRATFSIETGSLNQILMRLTERYIHNQLRFAVDVALANLRDMAKRAQQADQTSR